MGIVRQSCKNVNLDTGRWRLNPPQHGLGWLVASHQDQEKELSVSNCGLITWALYVQVIYIVRNIISCLSPQDCKTQPRLRELVDSIPRGVVMFWLLVLIPHIYRLGLLTKGFKTDYSPLLWSAFLILIAIDTHVAYHWKNNVVKSWHKSVKMWTPTLSQEVKYGWARRSPTSWAMHNS